MKQSDFFSSFAIIACAGSFLLATPSARADDTPAQYREANPHMGYGMMGGYGMDRGMMEEGYYGGRHRFGMMDSYGGMGSGMMGGRIWLPDELDLSDEQQARINKIHDQTRKARWSLMGEMMDLQSELRDLYDAPKRNSAAIDNVYKKQGQIQQKMYELNIENRKRIEGVLTPEQQEKLRKYTRRGWWSN